MNPQDLAHLTLLRERSLQAEKAYYQSPFGHAYQQYQSLKEARREYTQFCVDIVERMVENVSCEHNPSQEK